MCLQQAGSLAVLSSSVQKTTLLDCLKRLVVSKTKVHNSQLPVVVPWPRAPRDMGMRRVCCTALVSAGVGLSVHAVTSLLTSRGTVVALF